jgi:hypothetical protein
MKHRFVKFIPEQLEEKTLYISLKYNIASHLCGCGCGYEVVTPLSPVEWKLIFDGKSISLYPSIGNWDYPCKSHYWIKNGKVKWANKWSQNEIEAGRRHDAEQTLEYYQSKKISSESTKGIDKPIKKTWWKRIFHIK